MYIYTDKQTSTHLTYTHPAQHITPSTHHTHASHVFGIVNVYANNGIHPNLFTARCKCNRNTGLCPRRSAEFAIRRHYHMYSSTTLRVYTADEFSWDDITVTPNEDRGIVLYAEKRRNVHIAGRWQDWRLVCKALETAGCFHDGRFETPPDKYIERCRRGGWKARDEVHV